VLRASAGAGRGALLTKLTFFASVSSLGSILPVTSPLWGAHWPSLGALWGSLRTPGAPLGVSRAPSGALGVSLAARQGVSWGALGRSWALLGALWAPDGSQDAFARARSSENAARCFSLEPARARTLLGTRKLSHEPARSKTLESASRSSPLERQVRVKTLQSVSRSSPLERQASVASGSAFARARSNENAAECFSLEPARGKTILGTRKLSHEPARAKTPHIRYDVQSTCTLHQSSCTIPVSLRRQIDVQTISLHTDHQFARAN
jgi:hypothetical protein